MNSKISQAIKALNRGRIILLLDSPDREKEADMLIHAKFISPKIIKKFRKEAGGLICLVTDKETANELGLKYQTDILKKHKEYKNLIVKKTAYNDEPSFSIYINSKKVYTGITDLDRYKTIKEFANMLELKEKNKNINLREEFAKRFYSPGHVPLLIARDLKTRKGHSEYSIELAKRAKLSSAVVICEMLGENYKALSFKKVKEYAKKNKILFLEPKDFL
jgi:3,4-dihydroxy 2-butanone 4-phosphate synthase